MQIGRDLITPPPISPLFGTLPSVLTCPPPPPLYCRCYLGMAYPSPFWHPCLYVLTSLSSPAPLPAPIIYLLPAMCGFYLGRTWYPTPFLIGTPPNLYLPLCPHPRPSQPQSFIYCRLCVDSIWAGPDTPPPFSLAPLLICTYLFVLTRPPPSPYHLLIASSVWTLITPPPPFLHLSISVPLCPHLPPPPPPTLLQSPSFRT